MLNTWQTLQPDDAMSLLDLAQQHLSHDDVQNISQQLGTDPATAQRAIEAALPMMIGGMAHTAQQPGGAEALQSAANAGSMQPLGGGLGDILGGAMGGSGGGLGSILGGMLGQHQGTVQDGVQQASGLDAGKVGKLLILLAPFVLRALAKHQENAPATSAGGLGGSLQKEAQDAVSNAHPQVGGILGKILSGLGG